MRLRRRRLVDAAVRDSYWAVVHDCLVDVFGLADPAAARACLDRRTAVDLAPSSLRSPIFYHREPFDVASAIAEALPARPPTRPLPTLADPNVASAYGQILSRHGLMP